MNDPLHRFFCMKPFGFRSLAVFAGCMGLTVLCVLVGCQSKSVYRPMAGSYYLAPNADLAGLGRVGLPYVPGQLDASG